MKEKIIQLIEKYEKDISLNERKFKETDPNKIGKRIQFDTRITKLTEVIKDLKTLLEDES